MATDVTAQEQALTDSDWDELHAEAMAPPVESYHYKFPTSGQLMSEQEIAADNDIKTALHASAMPKFVAETIAQNLTLESASLASATPEELTQHVRTTRAQLEGLYGDQCDANLDIVDQMLEGMAAKNPAMAQFIQSAAYLLTPLDIDLLLQTAKHQTAKRGRG